MNVFHLSEMFKGWFVGDFEPTVCKTQSCEVAIKTYKKGDYEPEHYHKIATEITVIQKGRARMFNKEYSDGDILVIEPFEVTSFEALEDTVTVVVKIPGVLNDKFQES